MAVNDLPERPAKVPGAIDPAQVDTVAETDSQGGSARPASVSVSDPVRRAIRFEGSLESYQGSIPIPPPLIIAQYEDLYPGAAEKFFAHYDEQAAHRRKIELAVVETNNRLALRGQQFAAGLGFTGLVGSLIAVSLGQGAWGAAIATGCLVALVSVFLGGQKAQNQELGKKAAVQAKIRQANSEPPAQAKNPIPPPPATPASGQKPKQHAQPKP